MSDTTPPPQVWPTFAATDAPALIRFLVAVVGFEETAVYGEGDVVRRAELAWPLGGGVMLGSAGPGEDGSRAADDAWPVRPGGAGIYVVTDDVDALFARAVAAGAAVVREPEETGYGSREFGVRDPEGNQWSFGTYRGAGS